MADFDKAVSRTLRSDVGVLGLTAGLVGLGLAAAVAGRRSDGHRGGVDHAAQLRAYLADHLTGSDTAFAVVERLRESQLETASAALFERLYREFSEERTILRRLLRSVGGSPLKMRRLLGQTAGSVLRTAAGGRPGDLALFRTLESLAVGVQGKRCLWRAAQHLEGHLPAPPAKSFRALEAQAINQWELIERRRVGLASRTFGHDDASGRTSRVRR